MFEVRSLTPNFGAEIADIDLSVHTDDASMASVKELWGRHQLLLFRDQSLEEADLVAFSRQLGELEIHLRREYLSPDNPEILFISNMQENGRPIGILSSGDVGWHYDQIYLPKPAVGSLLYGVTLPSKGGSTSFADMSAAYEQLPDDIKARIDGRRAVQSYEAFNRMYSVPTNKTQKRMSPDIEQPLVRTHPVTGRRALYICPGMTTRIAGMDAGESDELLEYLFEWAVRPEFVYVHHWCKGDALLWDNACTMHRRDPFDDREPRLMKRTTILPPADLGEPVYKPSV